MKNTTPAIIGMLLLAVPAALYAIPLNGDNFNYTVNSNPSTITLTLYTGTSAVVPIPSAINGLTVTVIGSGSSPVFSSTQTAITIPASVTSIAPVAFANSIGLTTITVPDNVTSVGDNAFAACSQLTNFTLGSGVTLIQDGVFESCTGLTNVTIPDTVASIGYQAFEGCGNMTNVTFGSGLTDIGQEAFESCGSLSNVTIPDNVTSIELAAFGIDNFYTLTIGTDVKKSGGGCTIQSDAFVDCDNLTNVTIGVNVANIEENAFSGCNKLTNVTIGAGILEEFAFESLSDLTSVTLGNGVTSIGFNAFQSCGNLKTVTIGSGVTTIGFQAFANTGLTNAIIGSGLIGYSAFESCSHLTNITLGSGVPGIGFQAFQGCTALRSITIPDSVITIGFQAFSGCTSLTNVTIGNGVSSIGSEVFVGCNTLTNVTLGTNLSSIGFNAFAGCSDLAGLYFQGNAPSGDTSAFQGATLANITAYYYAGTTGWTSNWDGITTMELSPNSLQVTMGPAEAIEAGAQWQLDDGSLNNGASTTLIDLFQGSHTVSFTPIPGWLTPSNQTITISNSGAASVFGFYSPSNSSTPPSGLLLLTNGYGVIHHGSWPSKLNIGSKYTVKAVPDPRNLFAYWVAATNSPYSFSVVSTATTYTFTMTPGLVLSGNFVTNSFSPVTAYYNGLFSTTSGVTEETAGMLKNLAVHENGMYSGTLLINGGSHGLSGTFNAAGQATNHVIRPASQGGPLLVEMNLDLSDISQLTGYVYGTNTVAWTAYLTAYLASNALSSSQYTMLMLPDTNTAPTNSPGGDGYLLITNNNGASKITGALADGTPLSQSAPVSIGSYLPVYDSLYTGKGLLLGWINLDTSNTAGNNLTWIHPITSHGLYQAGFTNVLPSSQILLAPWANPPGGLDLLTSLVAVDTISDTNAVTNIIATSATGDITGTSITGTINPKTGLFKVTLGSGADKTKGYGAVLLTGTNVATNGGGYFLTTTNAQAIELQQ